MWIFEHYENEFISQVCLSDVFNLNVLMSNETQHEDIKNGLVKLKKKSQRKKLEKFWHLIHNHVPIWNLKFHIKKGFDFPNLNFTT